MFTKREIIAAQLLAIANDAFGEGKNVDAHASRERQQYDSNTDRSPEWVVAAASAIPSEFVERLRSSPLRRQFLTAADCVIGVLTKEDTPNQKEEPPCHKTEVSH